MKKKPRRKSKFKVPQKHKILQKLPKLIVSTESSEKKRNKLINGPFEIIPANRNFYSADEWERDKINQLDEKYYEAMRNFYNSIVPSRYKVPKDEPFFRELRSSETREIFFIVSSAINNWITIIGHKKLDIPRDACNFVDILGRALEENKEFEDWSLKRGLLPPSLLSPNRNLNKFFVLVEEEASPEFLKKDEVIVDFSDKEFVNSLQLPLDVSQRFEETIGFNPITIKVVNSSNHPDTFFHYIQIKHILNEIDTFGFEDV